MKRKNKLTLELPPEFIELCDRDGVTPELVLTGFIADLCQIMNWQSRPARMATAATVPTSAGWHWTITTVSAIPIGTTNSPAHRLYCVTNPRHTWSTVTTPKNRHPFSRSALKNSLPICARVGKMRV